MVPSTRDEPRKVVLVPESLYDPVCSYIEHLERDPLQPVGKPAGSGGPTDDRGRESGDTDRSARGPPGVSR